jgi:U3 small nucleolar RNA-associated protein 22
VHRFDVVLLDTTGQLNLLASISESGFTELIWHAQLAVRITTNAEPHLQLEQLFYTRLTSACKFDMHVVVTLRRAPDQQDIPVHGSLGDCTWEQMVQQHAESVAILALGERAALVRTVSIDVTESDDGVKTLRWVAGLNLKAGSAEGTVDKGPAVTGAEGELTEFRRFWGSKSEVRRMKDGSIIEAAVWSNCMAPHRRHHVISCVLSHALQEHLQGLAQLGVDVTVGDGQALDAILFRKRRDEAQWKLAHDVFGRLAKKIRNCRGDSDGVSGLPLAIVRVTATSARLRRCSALPPRQHPLIAGCNVRREDSEPSLVARPMGVVVEFEGSGSWPSDDMLALRAIKSAMLLRLATTLERNFGIFSQATANFLDIFMAGFVFRISIVHQREVALVAEDIATLERVSVASEAQRPYLLARVRGGLTQAALPALRTELASLKRSSVFLPLHASVMGAMMLKHAPASKTVRLAKCWCHAHMFSEQVSPQAIELIVCYCFTARGAAPYAIPVSHTQGFLRFLLVLASHDWKCAPLVVDMDVDEPLSSNAIQSSWAARRQKPEQEMFIATNYDLIDSAWTQSNPTASVLLRIKSFANASATQLCAYLDGRIAADSLIGLFKTPLHQYDVLIHLRDEMVPAASDRFDKLHSDTIAAIRAGPLALPSLRPKNLQNTKQDQEEVLCGFNPASLYVEALREQFQAIAMIFYDELGGQHVGVSWLPAACVPQRGRNGLQLQMLSDAILIPSTTDESTLPSQYDVGEAGAGEVDTDQNAASGPAVLLFRNMFEIVERFRTLGEGVIGKIEFTRGNQQSNSKLLRRSLQA